MNAERKRCVALMEAVPWHYMMGGAGEIVAQVFIGQIRGGISAKDLWTVTGSGHTHHKERLVRLWEVTRPRGKKHSINMGVMFSDTLRGLWDARVRFDGKRVAKDGFSGPYEASAWVAKQYRAMEAAAK